MQSDYIIEASRSIVKKCMAVAKVFGVLLFMASFSIYVIFPGIATGPLNPLLAVVVLVHGLAGLVCLAVAAHWAFNEIGALARFCDNQETSYDRRHSTGLRFFAWVASKIYRKENIQYILSKEPETEE